jgi:protein-disulfide isomerase
VIAMREQEKAHRGRGERRGKHLALGVLALLQALILPAAAGTPAKSKPLAEVDEETITADEVDKAVGAPLRKLEEQIYRLKRRKLEALITERLLAREAAKRGVSVEALLEAEVTAKAEPVSEQEIETAYQALKAQLKGDEVTARELVRAQLPGEKLAARRRAFLESLRSQAQVVVHLTAPPVFRAEVSADGAPSKGPATAAVTVVEFADFHCPFCQRVQPILAQLVARYGERVKFVYRDFPIDQLHPQARRAHEAARCAHDQGKFWAYHDLLYAKAPKASPEELEAYAREAGLDMEAFERCLTGGTHQAAVQKDVDEGIRAGVTGTPTFFINGRLLSGAQPLESFVGLIEEELRRAPDSRNAAPASID